MQRKTTRCSRTRRSSAVQLRGRPASPPTTCGSSSCSRCSTSEVSHTYGEEAMRLRTARSARSEGASVEGDGGCQKAWIKSGRAPPSTYIGVPNVLPSWRPISNPKPCLIRVQPKLVFQSLKRTTLWVHVYIDMDRVLILVQ